MTWPDLRYYLLRPFIEHRLAKGLHQRFAIRSLLDIARKREEFRYKLLEAEKQDDDTHRLLAEKYRHYLDTLSWVLHADL